MGKVQLLHSRDYQLDSCPFRRALGVPVGTLPLTLPNVSADLADGVVSYIDTTVTQLQHQPQHLWKCISAACQHKIDFHLQHVWPERTKHATARVDSIGPYNIN